MRELQVGGVFLLEKGRLVGVEIHARGHLRWNAQRLLAQSGALFGDGHFHPAFVGAAAATRDEALRLHLLQKRRERAGVKVQLGAQLAYRDGLLLPENHHRQVLRVGQAQQVEQGGVAAHHFLRGGIEGKAQLVSQLEPLFGAQGEIVDHCFGHIGTSYWAESDNRIALNRRLYNLPCTQLKYSWLREFAQPLLTNLQLEAPGDGAGNRYSRSGTRRRTSSILSVGSKRSTTLPSRSMRNLVKFQRM